MNALALDHIVSLWRRSDSPGHVAFAEKLERHRAEKYGAPAQPQKGNGKGGRS